MKRKNTLTKLTILSILLTPTIINAKDYIICGTDKKMPTVVATLFTTFYSLVKIVIPLILVITGIIGFLKVIINSNVDESIKKAKSKFITNIICAIIIFFVASIINFVVGLSSTKNDDTKKCLYCLLHPNDCEQIDGNLAKLCPGLINDQDKYNPDCTINREKVEYLNPANANTTASIGGGAIARTLRKNPDAKNNNNLLPKQYGNMKYYLYIPKQIDGSKSLIVYLHGSGEMGNNLAKLDSDLGFSYLIKNGKEFNSYILLPQTSVGWVNNTTQLKQLIDYEVQQNGIDKNRIHLMGFSMGANALPTVAKNIPHYFASVSFVSISSYYVGENGRYTEPFKDVATYFFAGDNDGHSSLSLPYYNKLKGLGYDTNYKLYRNQAHGGFVNAVLTDTNFNNADNTNKKYKTFMDWVLDQRRTN